MKRNKSELRDYRKIFAVIAGICVCLNAFAAPKKTAREYYESGLKYQQEDNWYLASQDYFEVVEINPAFADAWVRLAECAYKLNEFDLAFLYLSYAEKYEAGSSEIQNLLGMLLLALGKNDEAREIFNNVLKKYPNDVDAHFGLAELELYDGKFSGAESQYSEALRRQNTNRKALLSLALVAAETGHFDKADSYIKQATSFYSGDSEVHYLSAVVSAMKGDYVNAEKQCKIAVEINENNSKAYELLSTILFMQKRYVETADMCDYLIKKDRNHPTAWYLKGLAEKQLGRNSEAIEVWSTGLSINPHDELMRYVMELEIRENLLNDDPRRKEWASYHIENAMMYDSRYDKNGAFYEYQRALLLDPMNLTARQAYADILNLNGMHEFYLEQLKFIRDTHSESMKKNELVTLNDKIEAYDSLLTTTLGKRWKVDPFYLDKIRWNIAIFYMDTTKSFVHADSERLAAEACADIFSGVSITSVKTQINPVASYGEAFRKARMSGIDYFIIVSMSEGSDDLTLSFQMYSGRTGSKTTEKSFYSTGNNRFSNVLRRFRNAVLEQLTVKGKVIGRNGKRILVDLGLAENIKNGAELAIIRKGGVRTAEVGPGVIYKDEDAVGTVKITECGEEISEGIIENHGFYDRINIGDELVLISLPSSEENGSETPENVVDNVPAADAEGKPVRSDTSVKGQSTIAEIKRAVSKPSIIELLRNIY